MQCSLKANLKCVGEVILIKFKPHKNIKNKSKAGVT